MSDSQLCTECGTPLPAYWPKGLCAQCAIDGALDMSHAESQVAKPAVIAPADVMPPESSSPLGSFGEYDLLEEIARGGMGVVYKARQRNLGRIVAVKMILAGSLAGKDFVQRFRTESAAAAILLHPNIVAIHAVGVHDGRHYFSMDYVEGQNLARLVGQQPLAPARAARYVETIAAAIHYAHERGILNRDLKPSNVLIDATDQPRITDFGLARRLDGDSSLTLTGQVLGSPNFMPPEQAGGGRGKVGRPSDVYALGGILYYLLTARAPFQADSLDRLLTQVLHAEPVSPRLLNPSVPRDLETITLKCLEKEPSRRYQTARELADELGRFLRREPINARPITAPQKLWRWGRRKPVLALLIVLLHVVGAAGLAGIVWQWHRAEHQRLATQHLLYVANMNLAQAAWEQNNVTRMKALLEETARARERGFEWYYWQRQMHLELMVLPGHAGSILAVAYSPNGQQIVTGGADNSAKVWDSKTGTALFSLNHSAAVSSVAFSRDGQRILTGSWDKTAKVWDATTGEELFSLVGHTNPVSSVAFSRDGQRIVTGSFDKTARVWEASTGKELWVLEGHTQSLSSVAFSPDGRWIVSGSWDQTAKVWDAATGHELRSLVGHHRGVLSVAFSPDSQRIVTGSQDHDAKLWEAATGKESATLAGHSAPVASVSFSPDGQRIATAGDDQTARVWDAGSGNGLLAVKRHGSQISSVAFSPDSQRIVTGGGSVNSEIPNVSINIGNGDRTARIWQASNDMETLTLQGHTNRVTSVAYSRDGQWIVTGSWDKTARVWEASTGRQLRILEGHTREIRSVAISPDGQRIVTGSWDKTARVWDPATGKELFPPIEHGDEIMSVAFSPDGRRIATGGQNDRTTKLWDTTTGKEQITLPGNGLVWALAFSPDGRRIVTGSRDEKVKLWEAATGACVLTLDGHRDQVLSVAFSPDGQRILTSSRDYTAKLWDAATGKELVTFKGHSHWVFGAAFSSDGLRIATASGDHTVRVWAAASPEEVSRWQQEEGAE
jgi:eukaryotic-like serine/threonine-protein kinase